MSQARIPRRAFLRSLGGVCAALPFARMLERSAYAQEAAPLRFLAVFTPHGFVPELWRPRGTETSFDIEFPGATLAPLAPYKSKIVVLDGIDYRVLYEKGSETGHRGGACTFLTGSKVDDRGDDVYPGGPSLDQFLATQLGGQTRFRSLELSVSSQGGTTSFNTINFGDGGARLPTQIDPAQVYARLFGAVAGGQDAAQMARAIARKQSVLDALSKDLTRMRGRLASPERHKIDQHLAALRDIEHRLGMTTTCKQPAAPAAVDAHDGNQIPAITRLQIDLIAQAFACDLTRFASLQIWHGGNWSTMPWIGLDVNVHDQIAHRVSDPGDGGAKARANLGRVQVWFAQQMAYLLGQLDAIAEPSGEGGTVLDHTVVLWGNELGNPAIHANLNVPMVLAGGAGGKLRTGRYLRYSTSDDPLCTAGHGDGTCAYGARYSQQTAHNGVLTAICSLFGIHTGGYGDPDYGGSLPGLL